MQTLFFGVTKWQKYVDKKRPTSNRLWSPYGRFPQSIINLLATSIVEKLMQFSKWKVIQFAYKKISKFVYLALTRFWCELNNEKNPTFWVHDIILWSLCAKDSKPKKPWDEPNKSMEDKDSPTWEQHISFYEGQLTNPALYLHIFVHKNLTHKLGNQTSRNLLI